MLPIKIHDDIYGDFDVSEAVLLKLIASPSLQRLRKIRDVPLLVSPLSSYNRYEHSVGVMLILRKFGTSLQEQIAGLLHDVSHTAFSHVIDRVMGSSERQDYQYRSLSKFIKGSEIPRILSQSGFDVDEILDLKNYTLLEREIPDICADRVDYALRNFAHWKDPSAVKPCINGLDVYDKGFIFSSVKPAKTFALNYLQCQIGAWGSVGFNLREHFFSEALHIGLEEKVINLKDFYQYDEYVMKKLRKSKKIVSLIEKIPSIKYEIVEENPDINLKIKPRYVDPKFLDDGSIVHLSEADGEYKKTLEAYVRESRKAVKVKVL